jgi:hypothetical protein
MIGLPVWEPRTRVPGSGPEGAVDLFDFRARACSGLNSEAYIEVLDSDANNIELVAL